MAMAIQDSQTIKVGRAEYQIVHHAINQDGYDPRYETYLHGADGERYKLVPEDGHSAHCSTTRWVALSLTTYQVMDRAGLRVHFRKVDDQVILL